MQPKLKEIPREWQKFTAVIISMLLLATGLLFWKGHLAPLVALSLVGTFLLIFLAALLWPRFFRGFYRAGMATSFWVGQFMGKALLTIFYLFLLTPMGWLLKLCGKDLLQTRPQRKSSYWQAVPEDRKKIRNLNQEF